MSGESNLSETSALNSKEESVPTNDQTVKQEISDDDTKTKLGKNVTSISTLSTSEEIVSQQIPIVKNDPAQITPSTEENGANKESDTTNDVIKNVEIKENDTTKEDDTSHLKTEIKNTANLSAKLESIVSEDNNDDSSDSSSDLELDIQDNFRPDYEVSSDDESAGKIEDYKAVAPPKTKNELDVLPPVEPLAEPIDEKHKIERIGKVSHYVGSTLFVASEYHSTLDLDSVLCLEDRTFVGKVEDVIGRIAKPIYCVRFNTEEDAKRFKVGSDIYYVHEYSHIVNLPDIMQKGSDASGFDDEEPPSDELEFSDDEEELKHKQQKKKQRAENNAKDPNKKKKKKNRESHPPAHPPPSSQQMQRPAPIGYTPPTQQTQRPAPVGYGPPVFHPQQAHTVYPQSHPQQQQQQLYAYYQAFYQQQAATAHKEPSPHPQQQMYTSYSSQQYNAPSYYSAPQQPPPYSLQQNQMHNPPPPYSLQQYNAPPYYPAPQQPPPGYNQQTQPNIHPPNNNGQVQNSGINTSDIPAEFFSLPPINPP